MNNQVSAYRRFKKYVYIFAICQGLIFWYGIEKLFEQSLGFSLEAIIAIGVVAQGAIILFEVPSSILADKWHRRNTLVISSVIMMIATVGLTLVKEPVAYALVTLLWTIYVSFKSGTDSAFIYDSLKSFGKKNSYKEFYARYAVLEDIGLILSGVVIGYIASKTSLVVPFWLTLIPLGIGIWALLQLPEPDIERETDEDVRWWHHAKDAWLEVRQKRIVWVMLLFAALFGTESLWYEYYQLYGLAVKTPDIVFGFIITVLCLGLVTGSEIARRKQINTKIALMLWVGLAAGHLGGIWISGYIPFLIVLFITMVCMRMLYLSFSEVINHRIESKRRATVISLAGSVGNILFLALVFIFSKALNAYGAPMAFLFAGMPLLLFGLVDLIRKSPWVSDALMVGDAAPPPNADFVTNDPR